MPRRIVGVTTTSDTHRPRHGDDPYTGSAIGLLAAAAALGAGELAAGLLGTQGPVIVVGDAAVDHSPAPLQRLAIAVFGIHDKAVLVGGILAALAVGAALLGALAQRRPATGYAGLAVLAAAGVLAALVRRTDDPLAPVPVVVGALFGSVALFVLLRCAARAPESATDEEGPARGDAEGTAPRARTSGSAGAPRRGFLVTGAVVLAASAGAAGIGRRLSGAGGGAASPLPPPDQPLPPLPAGADLKVPGLAPFTTPRNDFYRIDTALVVPRVDPARWSLRIHGMVDRPVELTYDDLLGHPLTESDTTLACVSNEIGGGLVGNTRWLGVRLEDVLRRAGVQDGADQVLSTSVDGWTCGTPTEAVVDGRDALLAIAMDGRALPPQHGFPVRMVVPGLYGFVSATKWVTDLRLTRFADATAYWAQRGWAVRAPVKTMSRIDVPGPLQRVSAGETAVAGVAWAQRRGVAAVEVRLDGGAWEQAQLAAVPGIDTWRQWIHEVDLAPGRHMLECRATDAAGHTQTSERAQPVPDGATGWHSVQVIAE